MYTLRTTLHTHTHGVHPYNNQTPHTLQFLVSFKSSLGTLPFTLTLHIHLTILISAHFSATWFSLLTGQVSLPCSILLHTQLLYSLPLLSMLYRYY